MAGKFELYRSNNGDYRFRLKAGNGEPILSSQGYSSRRTALNGIQSVQTNGGRDDRYERKEAKNGKHYFVLKAGNHQVIGQSQMYDSTKSCEGGIKSVKKNSQSERIAELSA